MGLLDSLDPQTQGLLAAAFQGLQASGPSRMPTSLGQIMGQAGSAGLNEYQQSLQLKRQKDLADQQMQLRQAQIDKLNREGALTSKLLQGGLLSFDPNNLESTGTLLSIMGHQGGPALLNLAERQRKTADAQSTLAMLKSQQAPITDMPTAGFNQNGYGVRSVIPPGGPMVPPSQMPPNIQATEPIPPEVLAAQQSGQPFSVGVGASSNPAENTQRVGGLFAGDIASSNPTQAQQGLLGQNLVDNATGTGVNPQKFIDMQARLSAAAASRQQAESQAKLVAGLRNPPNPIAVIGPNNNPVYVPASEAVGKTPANQFTTTSAVTPENSSLTGDAFLKTLDQGTQNTVKGIVTGQIPLTTFSIRNNQRGKMAELAMQYDPTFEAGKGPARMAVYKDFTSGPTSKNVTAINTGIAHLGSMGELADALGNGTIPAINKAVQFVKVQTGDPTVTNFDTAKQAVATELMRVFRQVNASETEMKDWEKKFLTAGSPDQIQGAMRVAATLLKGRIEAVNDQWNRGMDKTGGYPNLLSPKSQQVLAQYGVNLDQSNSPVPAVRKYNPTTGKIE